MWAASWVHDIFMGHGGEIAERAERMNEPGFVDAVVGRCSGVSYTYRDDVGAAEELAPLEGPAIGDRAPDADLGDGRTLFDLTRHTGFTLFSLPGQGGAADTGALFSEVRARYGDLVACHELAASPGLAGRYGDALEARLYLLRPDGYIGWRCSASASARMLDHLGSTLITI